MSSSERTTTTERDEVRFSLRGLMLLMTAVAIVAGVLGTCLQGIDPEARPAVLMMWGISTAIVVGRVGYCAVKRWRLVRTSGRTQFVLAPRGVFGFARSKSMTILIGLLWITVGIYYLGLTTVNVGRMMLDAADVGVIPSIVSGVFIAIGIGTLSWNRTIQLRDEGVLRGIRLLRWSHITKHDWETNVVVFEGVDQSHRDAHIAAVAADVDLDSVKSLVKRKLHKAAAGWTLLQPISLVDDAKTTTPRVRLDAIHNVTWHGIGTAFFAYVVLVIVSALLFRPLGAPSRELWYGIFIGFGLTGLKLLYEMCRSSDTGAPLVRLAVRLDWPSVMSAVCIAVGCYYISQQLLFPQPLVGYSLGICSGLAMCALGGMVMRAKLDLCEHGVVLVRWPFLPWKTVRVLKWRRDGNDAVILRSGWRRIKARVPQEHREFVDRVLSEKAGLGRAIADCAPNVNAATQSK